MNLLKHLKKHRGMDKTVELGKERTVRCRIVAVRLPDDTAAERVRKAKADRNSTENHTKQYYEMLRYSIYITTRGIIDPVNHRFTH